MALLTDRTGPSRHRAVLVVAAGVLLIFASSACRAADQRQAEPPCLPPDYSVSPSNAKTGETVTVHAEDADCNPRYGQDALIQVIVTDATGQKIIKETGPMNDAGGFTFQFAVPEQAAAGAASVEAVPFALDWCDDTGRNNRVPRSSGMQRASCAARTESLTIAP
jgi:hypothetical protein